MLIGAKGFKGDQIANLKVLGSWELINTEIVKKSKAIMVNNIQENRVFKNKKIPFSRTPKVENWTMAPSLYILSEYFLASYCLILFVVNMLAARWFHAVFALLHFMFFAYAIRSFMGLQRSKENLIINWNASK